MKKKRLFRSLILLFSSSLVLGTFLGIRLAQNKDNDNVVLAYEGTRLPTSGTLSAGTYYLDSDLTVSSQLKITSGDVIVNLNGHTLNGGGRDKGIFYVTGGSLTVNGKDDETGNRGALNNGGGYYPGSGYSYGGALYITAGAATFSDLDITNCQSNWGGAISMSNSAVTLNNCNLSNNMDTNGYGFYGVIRVGDSSAAGTGLTVNGGEMFSNDGAISVGSNAKATINGAYIHNNEQLGVRVDATEGLTISGNTIIEDNNSTPKNLVLNNNTVKVGIVSELGNDAYIGVTVSGDTKGVFTNSTDTSLNDVSKFFSDDSGYAVGKNDDGQLFLGVARTVTYSTEYGTAPDPVKVATGCTIPSEPISPTAEGYDFLGWYKESTFENAWDFATDVVTSDITLYAKWLTLPVASITKDSDVTYYDSFDDALSHWEDDSTLTLHRGVTTSTTITINNDVILDLNGYGIRASSTGFSIFNVASSGNLTVNDSNTSHAHEVTLSNFIATGVSNGTGEDNVNNGNGTAYINGGYVAGGYIGLHGGAFFVSGGTLTLNGGTIIGNKCDQNGCAGGGIYVESNGYFTMNGGSIKYNYAGNAGAGIAAINSTIEINGGVISSNTNNWSGGGAMSLSNSSSLKLYGGVIENNVSRHAEGAISFKSTNQYLSIKGSPIVRNNTSINSGYAVNLLLNSGLVAQIEGPLTEGANIHLYAQNDPRAFTNGWSTYMEGKDPRNYFFSDKSDCIIGLNAEGEAVLGSSKTVAYSTEHGTAPTPATVASGSIILDEPTEPTEGDYVFAGWYKESTFENAWDFATDVVTSDMTLYAKWYDSATANVIKLINDIGDLTYAGGANDSLDDIIAAKTAFDALTPAQQENVVNKDVLDHDIVTYNHVDKVGDLIKAIPEASDSQDYYDAVEAALAAYKALTDEEKAILNANLDFQYKKTLDDNIAAKEAIELIKDIGDVTYKGGQDDSKDDIETAVDAYNNLTDDQKAIVDNVNKDELDDAKETYDNVDETIKLIESIGDINHGGENDSKEAIDAAREAYDNLSDEEKALVDSYGDSTQTLEDAEEVYDVLVKIDDIGEGDDEEKIKTARDAYDDLTPGQKDKVSDDYVQKLIAAENHFKDTNKQANILFIVFLILFILLIVSGLIVLYILLKRRKDENSSNNKQVKFASVSGLLPLVILASYFTSTKFIILYVLAAVAILIWLTNLILFVSSKRQKEAKVEAKPETVISAVPQVTQTELINEDEEEVETIKDETGNIFQIRFIKSFTAKLIQSPEETKKYYEELKNEVLSYKKTNSRISWHYDAINSGRNYVLKFTVRGKTLCVYFPLNVDDYSDSKYKVEKVESKKFEDVPCLYRIKNDRRLDYAKELIEVVANNLGLEKGEEQHEVYSNLPYEPNKPLVARGLIKEQKIQVNKPATEPVVLETKTNSDGDEVIVTKDASGNIFEIRYIKSFTAKLSQSEDIVKDYYTELKNYVLSYKDTHSRVSWHYDAINVGRDYVLKFTIRGKTLCVYYALDVSKLDDKYKVEKAKGRKFEDVSCLYRIKNNRRLDYAKELIDLLMSEKAISKGREQNEDYHIPSESTKALLAKGLIKEVKSKVQDKEVIKHYESISVSKADELMSDEKAESSIEEMEVIKPRKGSKEIINIDTLSENYNNGDEVTLESLIKKGLVPTTTGRIKVLARGVLDKKLDVIANDFSLPAIKMIVLVGGHVKKIK